MNSNDIIGSIITTLIGILFVLIIFGKHVFVGEVGAGVAHTLRANKNQSNGSETEPNDNDDDSLLHSKARREVPSIVRGDASSNEQIQEQSRSRQMKRDPIDSDNLRCPIAKNTTSAISQDVGTSGGGQSTAGGEPESNNKENKDDGKGDTKNTWRCACENGFLPPNLLKSFGGVESMVRMGAGQCYHKV